MKDTNNSILIPVDFSDQSTIALNESYNLIKSKNAELVLLHVIKGNGDSSAAKQRLDELAAGIHDEQGIKVSTILKKGKPFTTILNVAKEIQPHFIIMGYHGVDKITGFAGENPFLVVRKAPCPVVTVKGKDYRKTCENIVLPLDFTKETREKVAVAMEFAKIFGSTIRILGVVTSNSKIQQQKVKAYCRQTLSFVRKKGVECTSEIVENEDIVQAVIDYAATVNADMVLIMTSDELGLKEYFMGTISQHLINKSEVPVVSVRPRLRKVDAFM